MIPAAAKSIPRSSGVRSVGGGAYNTPMAHRKRRQFYRPMDSVQENAVTAMNKSPSIEFRKLRVLVYDKNNKRAGSVRKVLDNLGIGETFDTSAVIPALERIRIFQLSMMLVDLEDKDEPSNSIALMEALRDPSRSPAPGLPVLGIMKNVTRENLIAAIHVGLDFVIQRPFTGRILANRIIAMLSAPAPQFVSSNYTGPDRRRMPDNLYDGDLRRGNDSQTAKPLALHSI